MFCSDNMLKLNGQIKVNIKITLKLNMSSGYHHLIFDGWTTNELKLVF
jgi:hypothetical protein